MPISHDTTRPIKKWVDAIPSNNDANISGYATDRCFVWSVGDLTVDGVTYANVDLRYNRVLDQWSVRSYPTEHKVFAPYVASGVNTVIAGDDDGQIILLDKASTYTDHPNATPISYIVETQDMSFGTNRKKRISDRLIVRGEHLEGATASVIVDRQPPVRNSKNLLRKLLGIFNIAQPLEGTEIAFRVEGQTTGNRAYIREIEANAISVLANYE